MAILVIVLEQILILALIPARRHSMRKYVGPPSKDTNCQLQTDGPTKSQKKRDVIESRDRSCKQARAIASVEVQRFFRNQLLVVEYTSTTLHLTESDSDHIRQVENGIRTRVARHLRGLGVVLKSTSQAPLAYRIRTCP